MPTKDIELPTMVNMMPLVDETCKTYGERRGEVFLAASLGVYSEWLKRVRLERC